MSRLKLRPARTDTEITNHFDWLNQFKQRTEIEFDCRLRAEVIDTFRGGGGRRGERDAYWDCYSLDVVCVCVAGFLPRRIRSNWYFGRLWAAAASHLRAANPSWRGLPVGARLLGLRRFRQRLLLGAGHVGLSPSPWLPVDARLLGLGRQRVLF